MINSKKIRRSFLKYFQDKGHTIVPSSPVVCHNDPSLLFTNAGMNQFKDFFLAKRIPEYRQATSSQKCIRAGGKHNDLENVGHTNRHLTFFEMLGNFSFGSYFKKEAISLAWDVSLNVFEYDSKNIWASVFYEDEEAFELWKAYLPENHIVRMGAKDNFWDMGETGPCGPCSELYFDLGPQYGHARSPAEDVQGTRFLEFWNLVFMQFNRESSGNTIPLKQKAVDTGAGLERVLSIKLKKESLFETDILLTLINRVEEISKKKYSSDSSLAPAFRVIADHIRTVAFAIADGVQPSNIEHGYILRKIIRRAVRYGKQLDLNKPFLHSLVPCLIELMGEDFPELSICKSRIEELITAEEEGFLRTLKRGGNLLNQIIVQSQDKREISAEDAFKLKDTYGFPIEEIILLAKDANLAVDLQNFEQLEKKAKERSRLARPQVQQKAKSSCYEKYQSTSFLGYKELTTEAVIIGIIKEEREVPSIYAGEEAILLLDQTPFYAERGGQVSDQGWVVCEGGQFEVLDCQIQGKDTFTHHGIVRDGELRVGDVISANVNLERRSAVANNHTATHLLHWALQQVVGAHVQQAGSVVEPNRIRFDFSHHKQVSKQELQQIEDLVNGKIRENIPVHDYEISYHEAQTKKDIKQFFGEKYGTHVRVIDIDFSKELCGGTHVARLGNIGYFRILKEGSIASGVRRIEATTGATAEAFVRETETGFLTSIDQLSEENKNLNSRIKSLEKELVMAEVKKMADKIDNIAGVPFLMQILSYDSNKLQLFADGCMQNYRSLVLLLLNRSEKRFSFMIRISDDLVKRGFKANELMNQILPILGGQGGGKAQSAQGGFGSLDNSEKAFEEAKKWLAERAI